MVSFWYKLNDSGKNDIATTLYKLIYHLNEQNQLNSPWLNHIKTIIKTNGFGNVWTSHNEVNSKWLVQAFKQKLKDQYIQTWSLLVVKIIEFLKQPLAETHIFHTCQIRIAGY